jgi:23S rRNA (adenine2030-N6)-methyltransferase
LKPVARFHAALAALAIPKSLRVELMLERPRHPDRLNGCGLIVVNPPYTLDGQLGAVLPELSRRLASTRGGGGYRLDWLDPADAGRGKAAPEAKRRMRIRP